MKDILAALIYIVLAPVSVSQIWAWCEDRRWYRNSTLTVWVWSILAGPAVWIGLAYRWLYNDWKLYMTLRDAQWAARQACKESEGHFTYQDGRLVSRALTTFNHRLLNRSKPWFWRIDQRNPTQALMTVGDHMTDKQVVEFTCTRDTIINRLRLACGVHNSREERRWAEGLALINSQREGWHQSLQDNGQYVWKSNGKGGFGWCRVCNVKIKDCQCKTEDISSELETLRNTTSADC